MRDFEIQGFGEKSVGNSGRGGSGAAAEECVACERKVEFIDGVESGERADQGSAAFAVEAADPVICGKRVKKAGQGGMVELGVVSERV